ncbi:hypothetical protein RZN05_15390 [Sphingomonas sp. HF-S4]|uniref:Uncharacterized protein n=1 Tax=Sphingomonas agrestis TaxID=3080540 RepID=A0ABU3YAF8_9SPHN|nr:hypothetical protein [Sphingomonas sp. HF-S4]MDV3458381.1 hypothetical protein [Sphingomonas sp. HF-S4]
MAVSAIFFPEPTSYQYTVFRIILALAAAGFASFLPGFLHVRLNTGIRAGGALAAFVIVYFFAPAALTAPDHRSDAARQADFAYSAIFGPEPGSTAPPVRGAKIQIGSLTDAITGHDSAQLVQSESLKLLVPFYIGTRCPRPLFASAVIVDTLSPYLSQPVEIFIFNVGVPAPSRFGSGDLANGENADVSEMRRQIMRVLNATKGATSCRACPVARRQAGSAARHLPR